MQAGKNLKSLKSKLKKPSKKNYSREAMMMAKKQMMMQKGMV